MTHDYKYEGLREEDRNALIPGVQRMPRPLFADWGRPVFDGPIPKSRTPHDLKLNTEGDE